MFSLINILNKKTKINKVKKIISISGNMLIARNNTLFSHISINKTITRSPQEILLLPPPYKEKHISGLMSFSETHYKLLLTNSEVSERILLNILKVLYNFFAKKKYETIDECLLEGLKNVFNTFDNFKNYNVNQVLGSRKELSVLQHLMSIVFKDAPITYRSLEVMSAGVIDVSGYQNETKINVLTLIEVFVLKMMLDKKEYPNVIFLMHNPNFPSPEFSTKDSLLENSQTNSDSFYKVIKASSVAMIKYIDIKMYSYCGIMYNRLSLLPQKDYLIHQEVSNIINSFKAYLKANNISGDHPYQILYEKLMEIIEQPKLMKKEQLISMIKLLCEAKFNVLYKDLPISLSMVIGYDSEFRNYYDMYYKALSKKTKFDVNKLIENIRSNLKLLEYIK